MRSRGEGVRSRGRGRVWGGWGSQAQGCRWLWKQPGRSFLVAPGSHAREQPKAHWCCPRGMWGDACCAGPTPRSGQAQPELWSRFRKGQGFNGRRAGGSWVIWSRAHPAVAAADHSLDVKHEKQSYARHSSWRLQLGQRPAGGPCLSFCLPPGVCPLFCLPPPRPPLSSWGSKTRVGMDQAACPPVGFLSVNSPPSITAGASARFALVGVRGAPRPGTGRPPAAACSLRLPDTCLTWGHRAAWQSISLLPAHRRFWPQSLP